MESQQNGSSSPSPNLSKYVVFKSIEDSGAGRDLWERLGEVEAHGAYNARERAIEQYDLIEEARRGDLEMICLGARFWTPKRPKVNVSESLDVS